MVKLVVDDDVTLRAVAEADTDEMFRLVHRNRAYLREWLPWLDANRSAEDLMPPRAGVGGSSAASTWSFLRSLSENTTADRGGGSKRWRFRPEGT